MSEFLHTKGPWRANAGCDITRPTVLGADDRNVAIIVGQQDIGDMFLIAAAPDLFEALERLLWLSKSLQPKPNEWKQTWAAADAAVQKARGKP